MLKILTLPIVLASLSGACQSSDNKAHNVMNEMKSSSDRSSIANDTATFGAGCFWCIEAVFKELKGVVSVTPGYSGGEVRNPTYREVCTGKTGHAEVAQIVYNPARISFEELLEVFWQIHDPTTLNRQGNDVGTQYRSVVFYHNEKQKRLAELYKQKLDHSGAFKSPVITEINPFTAFYMAENYHRDYFEKNPDQPYCIYIIAPKMEKFRKVFKEKLMK